MRQFWRPRSVWLFRLGVKQIVFFRRVIGRYFRKGGSYAVIVPVDARKFLQLCPGDFCLFTLVDDAAVLIRLDHERLIELSKARKKVRLAKSDFAEASSART